MLQLPDYTGLTRIHVGSKSIVYRAQRRSDGTPVVLKTPTASDMTPREISRYEVAHELSRLVDHASVCRSLDVSRLERRVLQVMEDIGGETVASRIASDGALPTPEVLRIALAVTEALGVLHAARVVHRDVNPSNIVVADTGEQIQIIDFDIASRLRSETVEAATPTRLEGTLAYISPEQTGRMNRAVDQRTDFYSLGATLYEMCTGQPPFAEADPLGLVHCHLAVLPKPPSELNPEVPQTLSRIVMKLLAKTPEARYQSAFGLAFDLRHCFDRLDSSESDADFELGTRDRSSRLKLSQKLYGREEETAALLDAFDRSSRGKQELVLVAGYSGIGKSLLVNEIHRPIARARGRFTSGKFEQLQNVPYAAFIDAISRLVSDILTESEASVAASRERLREALQAGGAAILDVVPEVRLLTGDLPAAPPLPPTEAQNRLRLLFAQLARAFSSEGRPLALFLDDLQWADAGSLALIELLVTDSAPAHILVIGAYRDNEVDEAHPLARLRSSLQESEVGLQVLKLEPLGYDSVAELLADSFATAPAQVAPLATEVMSRTAGNPFFIDRLLMATHAAGALSLDQGSGRWTWDLDGIRALGISENVADLMVENVRRLPEDCRHHLQIAACLGTQVDLREVAEVSGCSVAEVARTLWPAVEQEMVFPVGGVWKDIGTSGTDDDEGPAVPYRFVHDRIQEAAYLQVPESERSAQHLRIGRVLRDSERIDRALRVFDIVNQLHAGRALLVPGTECDEVAALTLTAAQAAMAAAAYDVAQRYFQTGCELLPADRWDEVAFQLHRGLCDASMLAGDLERSEDMVARTLERVVGPEQAVAIYRIKANLHMRGSRNQDSVEAGLSALALFGFERPESVEAWGALTGEKAGELGALLDGVDLTDLVDLPAMSNPEALMEMGILMDVCAPAYTMPHILPVILMRMVELSLRYGNSVESALGYATYGFLVGLMGDFATGHAFAELALALTEKLGVAAIESPVTHLVGGYVNHWRRPLSETLPHLRRSVETGLATGAFNWAAWSVQHLVLYQPLFGGTDLPTILADVEEYLPLVHGKLRYDDVEFHLDAAQQVLWELVGRQDEARARVERGDGPLVLAEKLVHYGQPVVAIHTYRAMVLIVMGESEQGRAALELVRARVPEAAGAVVIPMFTFWDGVALFDQIRSLDEASDPEQAPAGRDELLARLTGIVDQVAIWAENCPANHGAAHQLLAAFAAELRGEGAGAAEAYEAAVGAAREQGKVHIEGIGAERAAAFFQRQGRDLFVRAFLTDARYAYGRWGATTKVAAMESEHPFLRSHQAGATVTATASGPLGDLDIQTVLKATQAISSEIRLERLLRQMMAVMAENAGAQRGCLLLESEEGDLVLAAAVEAGRGALGSTFGAVPASECEWPTSAVRYVARSRRPLVVGDASSTSRFADDPYVAEFRPRSLLGIPIINQGKLLGVLYLENRLVAHVFTPDRVALLRALGGQAAISLANARLFRAQEAMTESMSRFVPQEFLAALGKRSIQEVQLGDAVQREAAVLMTDIRKFTTATAMMTPAEGFRWLNGYLAKVGPIVRQHGGFVDQFIGDAVVGLFPHSVDDALDAAVGMYRAAREYRKELANTALPPFDIGAGIHFGGVMLGMIGEERRLDATVISDIANVAARLEGATKEFAANIIVSGSAFSRVKDSTRFPHRRIGTLALRGKADPIPAIEIFAADEPEILGLKTETRSLVEDAVRALQEDELWEAGGLFQRALKTYPQDGVCAYYLRVISERMGRPGQ